jgi:hypothetical protein
MRKNSPTCRPTKSASTASRMTVGQQALEFRVGVRSVLAKVWNAWDMHLLVGPIVWRLMSFFQVMLPLLNRYRPYRSRQTFWRLEKDSDFRPVGWGR